MRDTYLSALHMLFTYFSLQTYEVGIDFIPILEMGKWRHIEVKQLRERKKKTPLNWDSYPSSLPPEFYLLRFYL